MKRSAHVLIFLLVPGAAAYYAIRFVVRHLSAWREEERRTISDPTWHRDFARRVSYEESQASVSEPMPWARPPRISDGPSPRFDRVGIR